MTDSVKEKKGFYDSIYESAVSRDGFSGETLPASIWKSFKLMFTGKFSLIMKISMLNLVTCLPLIAWCILIAYFEQPVSSTVPYSGNIGVGYGYVPNAAAIGNYLYYTNAMFFYGVLTACIVIAALGAGSLFCVARKMLWGEKVRMFSDYWDGLKTTWVTSLIGGVLSSGGFMLMVMNLYIYNAYSAPLVGKVFGIIGSVTVFALLCIYSVYLVSLNATYKMTLPQMLAGAFKLTVGRLFPNIMMVVFSAWTGILCWVVGEYLASFAIFAYALMFIVGIFFCVAVCTVNTHRQFDRFINTISDKNTVSVTYAKKSENEKTETHGEKKKSAPAQYVNPKKRKKKQSEKPPAAASPKISDSVKGGENGLDEDLSVYVDSDDE